MSAIDVGVWYALGLFSTVMFLLWAVVIPGFRVYLTSGLSFGGYALMALLSPDVATVTNTGAVESVPVSGSVTIFVGGLAVVSGLVFILDAWGVDVVSGDLGDADSNE